VQSHEVVNIRRALLPAATSAPRVFLNLMKVAGVRAVTRIKGAPFAMSIGGEEKKVAHDGPVYSAIYEIDGPHVLTSQTWAKAVEAGRWPSQVRPFTHNRRHALYKVR